MAADNPVSGPTSALRVNADNILLNGTVTSKKLIITDTTNLVANPDFLFGGAEWFRTMGDVTFLTGENDAPVPTVAQLVSTNAETSITTHGNFNSASEAKDGIPINAGDRFHVEAWVKSSAAGAYWPVHLVQRSAVTGALVVREPDGAAPSLAAGVWTKVTGTITVTTSGTAFLRLWNNLNNSTLKVTKLRLVKQSGGELLVDGGITAREIAAGAVTAAKIAANAVSADKIVAGAITAAKIAAGAITAEKIAAQTITANEIIGNGITRQGVAGSGRVYSGSSWTTIAAFTIPNMPQSSYVQGMCDLYFAAAPSTFSTGWEVRVTVGGLVVMRMGDWFNHDPAVRVVARAFTRQGVPPGDIYVALEMMGIGGGGVLNSNLSAIAAMR